MNIALYGSRGMAVHVMEALRDHKDYKIVLIVDEEKEAGKKIGEFEIMSPGELLNSSYEKIIVGTMNYSKAINDIHKMGISEKIMTDVLWDPFFIQLEPTTKCQFNCLTCIRNKIPSKRKNLLLGVETFQNLLSTFPKVKRLHLQGLGEPLMHPNLLLMLDMANAKGINTSITTNGEMLFEKMAVSLTEKTNKLVISLDAADKATYSSLRKGGGSDKVFKNIKHLSTLKKRKAQLVLNTVLSSENISAMEDVLKFTLHTKPDEIHFQMAENWYLPGQRGFDREHEKSVTNSLLNNDILKKIDQWKGPLKKEGVTITYSSPEKRRGKCRWPFHGLFITAEGYVTPCCIRMLPEYINFGNINEESVRDIWQNKKYHDFRAAMYQKTNNGVCDYCPL